MRKVGGMSVGVLRAQKKGRETKTVQLLKMKITVRGPD